MQDQGLPFHSLVTMPLDQPPQPPVAGVQPVALCVVEQEVQSDTTSMRNRVSGIVDFILSCRQLQGLPSHSLVISPLLVAPHASEVGLRPVLCAPVEQEPQ